MNNKMWRALSELSRYYIVSMLGFFLLWFVTNAVEVEFYNNVFLLLAYIWHFALLTPGLKEKIFLTKVKYSFLSVVVKINHYLQLFIKIDKVKFGPSIVRALSPLLFTFILMVATGNGNPVFTIIGSLCFEVIYLMNKRFIILPEVRPTSSAPGDQEMPPAIPTAENSHE